jgi:hypothetical protein
MSAARLSKKYVSNTVAKTTKKIRDDKTNETVALIIAVKVEYNGDLVLWVWVWVPNSGLGL